MPGPESLIGDQPLVSRKYPQLVIRITGRSDPLHKGWFRPVCAIDIPSCNIYRSAQLSDENSAGVASILFTASP